MASLYEGPELAKCAANFTALSPVSILKRVERVYPDQTAQIHGKLRRTWGQVAGRCRALASALSSLGVGRGDTVALLAPNIPEALECTLGLPLIGAVLNANNVRLDPETIAYILTHSQARVLLVDTEFSALAKAALDQVEHEVLVIDIEDPEGPGGDRIGALGYEELLAKGDPQFTYSLPQDEWDALALNYTSGTTGRPKGVVYSHRGAWTNAVNNVVTWEMPHHPVYLWTLPLFHCNGWCFPWTITLLGGTHVFLRAPRAGAIYDAFADHGVTHLCGAPIIMALIAQADMVDRRAFDQQVRMMTAAAPPPPSILQAMADMGIDITHTYGLTEVYGPAVVCAPQQGWQGLPDDELVRLKARQGVAYELQEDVLVLNPETSEPVPLDGQTLGEVAFRGNIVMKGYFQNQAATAEAFRDGWFWSGDLAVQHPDGYIEIRDRAKDIIISGGENISSIEVEAALYRHPAVAAVAVVAQADEKWGEVPCACVEIKEGYQVEAEDLDQHARAHLAGFQRPKHYVFGPLPKTNTGKVKKNELRTKIQEALGHRPKT